MLKSFSVAYLEEMLNSSTKSVAREVVSTLVKSGEKGTLWVLEGQLKKDYDRGEEVEEQEEKHPATAQPLKTKNTWEKPSEERSEKRQTASFAATGQLIAQSRAPE